MKRAILKLSKFQVFSNGISNKLVGIYFNNKYNEMVLVRVYGNKTDLLIDREAEIKNIKVLNIQMYYQSILKKMNYLMYNLFSFRKIIAENQKFTVRDKIVFEFSILNHF